MERLIIVGSPRPDGRSGRLADELFMACIDECPDDEVSVASVASLEVAPCVDDDEWRAHAHAEAAARAADAQAADAEGDTASADARADADADADTAEAGEAPTAASVSVPAAAPADDMGELYPLIEGADELIVVAPVCFGGPSAQFKVLLDRIGRDLCMCGERFADAPRPAVLHVVGAPGYAWGYGALVASVAAALESAGFALEQVIDWIGKIDAAGEIVGDAIVYDVQRCDLGEPGALPFSLVPEDASDRGAASAAATPDGAAHAGDPEVFAFYGDAAPASAAPAPRAGRPLLSLGGDPQTQRIREEAARAEELERRQRGRDADAAADEREPRAHRADGRGSATGSGRSSRHGGHAGGAGGRAGAGHAGKNAPSEKGSAGKGGAAARSGKSASGKRGGSGGKGSKGGAGARGGARRGSGSSGASRQGKRRG